MGRVIFLLIMCCASSPQAQVDSLKELPDDYVPFTLLRLEDRLEGESEYLEGFTVSMDLSREVLGDELSIDAIVQRVRNRDVKGTLAYPNGRTTGIDYEIVRHRGTEDIYMKTSLGYFLWEYVSIQNDRLDFAIYWWYRPPATEVDLEILETAKTLLADSTHWHKSDDRDCADDIESDRWSLFCALKHASMEKTGEYNHHNTAMQTVRFAIDEVVPDRGFEHPLMDFNNAPSTGHPDVLHVLELAKRRIEIELSGSSNPRE
jgi:hypothetical protein